MLYHSSTVWRSTEMDDEAVLALLIVCEPRQSADAATLAGSNIPVWQIIRDLKAAKGDVLAVAADYGLPRELMLAVRTYYLRHVDLIDARIQRDEAPRRAARQAA